MFFGKAFDWRAGAVHTLRVQRAPLQARAPLTGAHARARSSRAAENSETHPWRRNAFKFGSARRVPDGTLPV